MVGVAGFLAGGGAEDEVGGRLGGLESKEGMVLVWAADFGNACTFFTPWKGSIAGMEWCAGRGTGEAGLGLEVGGTSIVGGLSWFTFSCNLLVPKPLMGGCGIFNPEEVTGFVKARLVTGVVEIA